ncbi:AAA family ATPase [Siccirubricoccus phaeus]|uniref:AAA family ATPase n=1 Tax=Siccirubricoccus phaeus TaxID=2595053 RepID=UPI0011F257D7|nr:AAA family ATPase [Siccirubricoccus phaeus]
MRLACLEAQRYGPFEALRLEFDPRPGCLNLVLAPNGAGKSVLLRAICNLLFGIPARTPMDFRFGYSGMRLAAEAVDAAGRPFAFGRRKGQGNTLVDAAGVELPREALRPVLGEVDQPLLERLFVLGTERLRAGGEELLASGGALGAALQAAAGGLRDAHKLRGELSELRDRLAPTRANRSRPFYQGLDGVQAAQRALKQEIWRPEDWLAQEKSLEAAEAALAEAREAGRAAAAETARLQRIRAARPWLAAAEAARAWLAAHPDAPVLGADLAPRFQALRGALAAAEVERKAALARQAELAGQLAALPEAPELLAAADRITLLAEELAGAERAERELPRLEAAQDAAAAEVAHLLRQLGAALPQAEAARLVPPRAELVAARQACGAAAGLATALAEAATRQAEAAQRLEAARKAVAALPEAAAEDRLPALLREIREAGEPAAAVAAAGAALSRAQAALARALAEAAPWSGPAEALRDLPLPGLPTFERLAAARDAAAAELARAAEAQRGAAEAAEAAARRLGDLRDRAGLPDAAALAAARRHREAGWQLIRARAFGPTPPDPAAEAAFAGGAPLDLAFDRAVQAADQLADRLVAEAARLGEAQAIEAELAGHRARAAAAEAACQAAEVQRAAAASAWAAAIAPLGLPPDSGPAELRALLAARAAVTAALEAVAGAEAAQAALLARQASWAARLAAVLGQAPAPLPLLLDQAEARLAAEQALAKRRVAALAELGVAEREAAAAGRALETARHRQGEWARGWATLLARLGRPEGEAPEAVSVVLELLEALDRAVAAEAAARRAWQAADAAAAAFREAALPLLARFAPEAAAADPHAGLRALQERLGAEQRRAAERARLEQQLAALAAELDRLAAGRAALERDWAALLAAIGAAEEAAAARLLALAEERQRQVEALDQAQAALREAGEGRAEADLAEEAAALPPEALAAALAEAEARARAAEEAAAAAAREAGRLRTELAQRQARTTAVAAKADEQASLALLGRSLEEALVLQVARSLLEEALKSAEAVDGSALLARISATLRQLTRGAIARVVTQEGADGELRLLAEEPPDTEPKPVAALSEGTRDQLFLALRLIAIEDHVAAAPPLPFIADDILQSFDDDRALAALEALLALSRHTQVILLTHHPHLAALAGRLPEGSVAVREMARAALLTA